MNEWNTTIPLIVEMTKQNITEYVVGNGKHAHESCWMIDKKQWACPKVKKHSKLVHVIKQGPLNYLVVLALSNAMLRIEMIHYTKRFGLQRESLGWFINEVSQIFGILDPLPLVRMYFNLLCIDITQPPSLWNWVTPLSADVFCEWFCFPEVSPRFDRGLDFSARWEFLRGWLCVWAMSEGFIVWARGVLRHSVSVAGRVNTQHITCSQFAPTNQKVSKQFCYHMRV